MIGDHEEQERARRHELDERHQDQLDADDRAADHGGTNGMAPLATIQLVGLVNGMATEFDGQYVVEYDPARWVRNVIGAHLVTTPERNEALQLAHEDAQALWSKARGTRPDGRPDRPLTAFTIEVRKVGT